MSETKWVVRPNAIGSSSVVSVFSNGEYVVAYDMPIEDANLTAAAPDLAEALSIAMYQLETARQTLSDYEEAATGESYNSPSLNAAIISARVALSKARGTP